MVGPVNSEPTLNLLWTYSEHTLSLLWTFLKTLLFTAFLLTVLKILTYAIVSTWPLVGSRWEHVKRKMHPCSHWGISPQHATKGHLGRFCPERETDYKSLGGWQSDLKFDKIDQNCWLGFFLQKQSLGFWPPSHSFSDFLGLSPIWWGFLLLLRRGRPP